jgi:hypothetical protein
MYSGSKSDSDKKKNDKEENLNQKKKKTNHPVNGSSKEDKSEKPQKTKKPQVMPQYLPQMFQKIPVEELYGSEEKSKKSEVMPRALPKEFQKIQEGKLYDLSDDDVSMGADSHNSNTDKANLINKNKVEKKKKVKMSFV